MGWQSSTDAPVEGVFHETVDERACKMNSCIGTIPHPAAVESVHKSQHSLEQQIGVCVSI